MALYKLQFKPGINRETTAYVNEGGWWDGDKVRFRQGLPEKIGGWSRLMNSSLLGTCRLICPWIALDTNEYIGLGTNLKFYVYGSGAYNDITPIRSTTAAGDVTFTAGYTTLSASISDTDTTIPLTSGTDFPLNGGIIKIGNEIISYPTRSGNNLESAVRGAYGTTAASHSSGDGVGSASIIVSDTSNGAAANDFVTFSDATSLGGNITDLILNQEYQIASIINSGTYVINARTVSSIPEITTPTGLDQTFVFSTSSDSGDGGAATVGEYQINSGLDTSIAGTGWGAGTWSRGTWGSGADVSIPSAQLRLWSADNYGQNLIFNVRDGGVYYWEKDTAYPRAVELSSLAGATYAPTIAKQVLVSDSDRHVIAFGCDDEFTPGVQDPLLIRFSSQEDLTDWQSLPTNSAGSLRVGTGSEIVCAVEAKQQTLVLTDVSVHAMQYLGPPFTFGITLLSDNISIAGPNAAIAVDDAVFWMGAGEFFVYDGVVSQLPCDVKDYVFSDINESQTAKIVAGLSINYGEVWWFYPSAGESENDRYVVYNYQQKIWYYGEMARSAWTHKNEGPNPMAAAYDNRLYLHEVGTNDGMTDPPSPILAYIESSGQDIDEGDQFTFIKRIIPDLTFRNSTGTPSVLFTVKTSNFPGADFSQENSRVITKTSSIVVEEFTNQLYVRLRGRSFTFRIDSSELNVAWRLGAPRLDIRTDGRR